jgi:hypothetical protein
MGNKHGTSITTWFGITHKCFRFTSVHVCSNGYHSTGLPPALVPWVHHDGPPSPKAFGLNPDYVVNHPKALFQELPLGHTNRLLTANTDGLIYPQQRHTHTPPPSGPMWHETSFIEEHWCHLADVVIRYQTRDTKQVRDARIRIKDNGEGFWMQVRACRKTASESEWTWKAIEHTELTPVIACQQNKDYPWIIIGGKHDVGRYCKALSCPKLAEDAETTDMWFTVALAQIETQGGQRTTVIDDPMEVRRIRQGDLGVVFCTFQERKKEPAVYEGVRATRKQKNTSCAAVDGKVEDEAEGSEAKKQRTTEAVAPNLGKEVDAAGATEQDMESVMDGETDPHREGVMDGEAESNTGSVVHNEVEGVLCDAQPSYGDTVASSHELS